MPTTANLPTVAFAAAALSHSGLAALFREFSAFAGIALVAAVLLVLLTSARWRETGGPSAPWVRAAGTVALLLLLDVFAIVVVIRFLVLA
jgi:hypothetical protein